MSDSSEGSATTESGDQSTNENAANALPATCRSSFLDQSESTYLFIKDHSSDALCLMETMRQQRALCDVEFRVADVIIHAHRVVLASTSPYFNAMFTSEMMECKSEIVEMFDVDGDALRSLVEYAYTSQLVITEANVQTLLPAACLLQFWDVRDACCRFLKRQLQATNCLGIRCFADVHDCEELRNLCHQFALRNFPEVCNSEEFLGLDYKHLLDLCCSEELNVDSEESVFTAVSSWIKHDPDSRMQYAGELISCVRLPMMSRDFLVSHVRDDPCMTSHPTCKDLLIQAMTYHLLPEKRLELSSDHTRLRRSRRLRKIIMAIGGGSLFAVHNECEFYDPFSGQWTAVSPMETRRSRCGVAVAKGQLYVIGGNDGSQDVSTCEYFNPRTMKWSSSQSLGTRRSCLGVCEWNGLIFVAGGYDGASCLSSVERFDPLNSAWTNISAMTCRRRYVKLVLLDNFIYAIGGYDGTAHVNSVEKYDPKNDTWCSVASMTSRRSNMGVAMYDGFIYACGGTDGTSCLSSVERYDPKKDAWQLIESMNVKRSSLEAVAMGGALYVVGGNDGSTSLNSVEVYKSKAKKWVTVASMSMRRGNVGAAVLEVLWSRGLKPMRESITFG